MRTLAVDYGEKRIGLAISDPLGITANPLTTLRRDGNEVAAIERLVRDEEVERVVVGLPLNMNDEAGPAAERSLAFAAILTGRLTVPVVTWDERLTTVEAEEALREAGVKPAARRKLIDQVAAALILRSYLNSLEQGAENRPV